MILSQIYLVGAILFLLVVFLSRNEDHPKGHVLTAAERHDRSAATSFGVMFALMWPAVLVLGLGLLPFRRIWTKVMYETHWIIVAIWLLLATVTTLVLIGHLT